MRAHGERQSSVADAKPDARYLSRLHAISSDFAARGMNGLVVASSVGGGPRLSCLPTCSRTGTHLCAERAALPSDTEGWRIGKLSATTVA